MEELNKTEIKKKVFVKCACNDILLMKARAEDSRLSVSEFIRRMVFDGNVVINDVISLDVRVGLSRIKNNIMQIIRAAEKSNIIDDLKFIKDEFENLYDFFLKKMIAKQLYVENDNVAFSVDSNIMKDSSIMKSSRAYSKEKKDKRIVMKMSEAEYELIFEKAAILKISASEFIRRMVFNGYILVNDIKASEAKIIVARVGNNIHQIAKHVNYKGVCTVQEMNLLKEEFLELQTFFFRRVFEKQKYLVRKFSDIPLYKEDEAERIEKEEDLKNWYSIIENGKAKVRKNK